MDGDDLELFERSLRHATERAHRRGARRGARRSSAGTTRWPTTGGPRCRLLFELQGAANATSSALDHVVLGALGVDAAAAARRAAPRSHGGRRRASSTAMRLTVTGLATAAADRVRHRRRGRVGRTTSTWPSPCPPRRSRCDRCTASTRALGLVEVRGDAIERRPASEPVAGWDDAVAAGQLALAHELVGASRPMLELARDARPRPHPVRPADRARSRPSATGWPRPSWPSRWPTPCSTPPGSTARR